MRKSVPSLTHLYVRQVALFELDQHLQRAVLVELLQRFDSPFVEVTVCYKAWRTKEVQERSDRRHQTTRKLQSEEFLFEGGRVESEKSAKSRRNDCIIGPMATQQNQVQKTELIIQ